MLLMVRSLILFV